MAVKTSWSSGDVLTAADLTDTFAAKLPIAGGKILQIVRSTYTSAASTSSTSYVDSGQSITITPQLATSNIIVINSSALSPATDWLMFLQLTTAANVALSGAEDQRYGLSGGTTQTQAVVIGYHSPATTSATTYKLRFKSQSGTASFNNTLVTAQMYALEVSA